MSDQQIRDLLHEVADDVEPGDRLDAIRSATGGGRRTHRGWWVAGGAGLVAASVVTALALTTGGAPQSGEPDPAAPSPTTSTDAPPPTTSADESRRIDDLEEMRRASEGVHAVYYVGDTPAGPRLYREFRTLDPADPLGVVVAAAVGSTPDGRPLPPEDPDYRVLWPPLTTASAEVAATGDVIDVSLGGDAQDDLRSAGGLTPREARLAVEAVVRTAQGAVGERLPVRFDLYGKPAATVLGIPVAAAPVSIGSDLDVLAHVSLSDPFEGQVVDNDEPFVVRGAANSFEGNVVTRIQRWEGTFVADQKPVIAGTGGDRLFPFEVTFDLTDVPPGDYVVISQTDDPSGAGMFDTDTRRITVVD